MSGLQSSFNSNRYWSGERVAAYCHVPSQFFVAKARAEQAAPHEKEDPLVFIFLIFFLVYALCRITL